MSLDMDTAPPREELLGEGISSLPTPRTEADYDTIIPGTTRSSPVRHDHPRQDHRAAILSSLGRADAGNQRRRSCDSAGSGCQPSVTIIGEDGEPVMLNHIFKTHAGLERGGKEGTCDELNGAVGKASAGGAELSATEQSLPRTRCVI